MLWVVLNMFLCFFNCLGSEIIVIQVRPQEKLEVSLHPAVPTELTTSGREISVSFCCRISTFGDLARRE